MPRLLPTPSWKLALWTAPAFCFLAVALGGLQTGYSLRSMLLWGIAGLALGGMFVPELEPRSTRLPALWQMSCGALGGIMMAIVLGASALGVVVSALVGIALGFTAPAWLKHVSF